MMEDYASNREPLFCGDEWDHESHEWSSFGVYECAGYASHSARHD